MRLGTVGRGPGQGARSLRRKGRQVPQASPLPLHPAWARRLFPAVAGGHSSPHPPPPHALQLFPSCPAPPKAAGREVGGGERGAAAQLRGWDRGGQRHGPGPAGVAGGGGGGGLPAGSTSGPQEPASVGWGRSVPLLTPCPALRCPERGGAMASLGRAGRHCLGAEPVSLDSALLGGEAQGVPVGAGVGVSRVCRVRKASHTSSRRPLFLGQLQLSGLPLPSSNTFGRWVTAAPTKPRDSWVAGDSWMGLASPGFPGCPGTPGHATQLAAWLPTACVPGCLFAVRWAFRGGAWWGSRPSHSHQVYPPYPTLIDVHGERTSSIH